MERRWERMNFDKTLRAFIFINRMIDNIVKIAVTQNPNIIVEAFKITISEFDEKGNWQGAKKENAEVQEETDRPNDLS